MGKLLVKNPANNITYQPSVFVYTIDKHVTDLDLFATGNLYDLLTDYFVNQIMLGTALIKGE